MKVKVKEIKIVNSENYNQALIELSSECRLWIDVRKDVAIDQNIEIEQIEISTGKCDNVWKQK